MFAFVKKKKKEHAALWASIDKPQPDLILIQMDWKWTYMT